MDCDLLEVRTPYFIGFGLHSTLTMVKFFAYVSLSKCSLIDAVDLRLLHEVYQQGAVRSFLRGHFQFFIFTYLFVILQHVKTDLIIVYNIAKP